VCSSDLAGRGAAGAGDLGRRRGFGLLSAGGSPRNGFAVSAMADARFRRLASVDALRGLTVAAMLLVNNPGDWGHVYAPLLHADWHGCTPADLVFPFFLAIVGVSIALGVVPRAEAGGDRGTLVRAVAVRALRILGLGLLLHLLAW